MTDPILVGRPLTLRPATADDEPFLARVYAGTRAAELAAVSWTEEEKAAFVRMQFAAQSQHYREHYADTSFDVIVLNAEAGGLDAKAVGRLYVARWADEIRIVDIALLSEFCNRGVGTTLLRTLQSEAAAAGKPLRIHVERFNPALRLYERLGFRLVEDRGVYLFLEWKPAAP
jgi:ribosomal protein S18 acetylase RimI-like enzyme